MKALCLFSGGLDSSLAVLLIHKQGIEPVLLHFRSVFTEHATAASKKRNARRMAERLGFPLFQRDITEQMIQIVLSPEHGYGKNINPCIDCRILTLGIAKELMGELGCSFIVTGEVVGQRPMSQRANIMKHIEREAGVEGLVLRPLSAKCLPETIPEREGWVDREQLEGIKGRSRKRQMELAEQFGLTDYPTPAGGCLLTDAQFARRVKPLLERGWTSVNDIELATVGRHFWLGPDSLTVVGRNQSDNRRLEALARPDDLILKAVGVPGPTTVLRGAKSDDCVRKAAALTVRYAKQTDAPEALVGYARPGGTRDYLRIPRAEALSLAEEIRRQTPPAD